MVQEVMALTPSQVKRYSRHIIMNDVGSRGQRKLLQSKALIVGAGGLGSPSAVYLALAGVGTIGIVDFDVVEISNLQRQILHHTDDVGRPKLESARDSLKAYNPDVNVVLHGSRLESDNAMEVIGQYDLVINGADNFATRYLVNDACYLLGKPLVDGSILIFDGQSTVYIPGQGCYRCLFPSPPPPGHGAQLRGSRRAGGPNRPGGQHSGNGSVEAAAGSGRVPHLTAAANRRPQHELPGSEDQAEPGMPPVRGQSQRHRAYRLRGLLRGNHPRDRRGGLRLGSAGPLEEENPGTPRTAW